MATTLIIFVYNIAMDTPNKKGIVHWIPRILSIGFILFISLFSLDVFSEYSGAAVIVPLIMHLLPSILLLAVVLISWKHDLIGAVAFLGFAILYILDVGFGRPWSWYVGLVIPSAFVGILFLVSWIIKKRKTA